MRRKKTLQLKAFPNCDEVGFVSTRRVMLTIWDLAEESKKFQVDINVHFYSLVLENADNWERVRSIRRSPIRRTKSFFVIVGLFLRMSLSSSSVSCSPMSFLMSSRLISPLSSISRR